MDESISRILDRLSSRSVMERKAAIRELKGHIAKSDGFMARLSLHYVSEHDPSYTVRNIARQAFYTQRAPPPANGNWERVYLFHKE
ncbi:hypothetical protein L0Y65_04980 [Candidatus Micrarchaeota archaeon]|nr:hypothetical protein [Candidatus Micrarchaeota archaeon]